MKVPSTVAIAVETSAIRNEFFIAVARSGFSNGSAQCSSVKPCQVKLKRPAGSLNEKTTITKIGMKR